MNIDDLKNPELQNKLSGASSAEELVALAKEGGVKLSDDELDQVSGGGWLGGVEGAPSVTPTCPRCGSTTVGYSSDGSSPEWRCGLCGYEWDGDKGVSAD